ncbi:MAG: helix-turn-helix transcriptional regulator [Anaerolineaceae bacterium]
MKSTRERILQTLLNNPRATITDLADAVSINAISVRHHLTSLQAEGLVIAEEERHGVGRPRLVYILSEKGIEKFPTRYLNLTNRLLDQLKETLPEDVLTRIFSQMAVNLASTYSQKAKSLSLENKLEYLKEILSREGFAIEWVKNPDNYMITEMSCPYYHIGQNHPEVCQVDQTLISTLLSIPAEKIQCVLSGDSRCAYIISTSKIKEAVS